jgi:hypothetical protein
MTAVRSGLGTREIVGEIRVDRPRNVRGGVLARAPRAYAGSSMCEASTAVEISVLKAMPYDTIGDRFAPPTNSVTRASK